MAKSNNIPVYLFTGFLEAGKTRFAQETLEDESFNNGERILLLLCEEGEEEFDPAAFAAPNIFIEPIEQESELTAPTLAALLKKHNCRYVMVEYNGMWGLDSLYNNMPPEWVVSQEFMFADARSFVSYNANMRQLMVDKMKSCELAVFNRFPSGDEELKMAIHKAVRAVNRRCDIAFEAPDGKITYDDIEIPLPYNLDAPLVEIADGDFAFFFQDMMDKLEKYEGKTFRLTVKAVTKTRKLKPGYFFVGRDVMTCCANDIQFVPIAAEWKDTAAIKNLGWYTLTARLDVRRLPGVFDGDGPVLHVQSIAPCPTPEQEVATFY